MWLKMSNGRSIQSTNGTSTTIPSRAMRVSGNTARASARSSGASRVYRGLMWVRIRLRTPASSATRAASDAVLCPVSTARSASSPPKVASWMSRSAPRAAAIRARCGRVSPEYTTVRAHQVLRAHRPAVVQPHRFPSVQVAPQWPFGHAELPRPLGMEPAETGVLGQRVPHRIGAVVGLEHHDVVLVPAQAVAGPDLDHGDRELVPLDPEAQRGGEDSLRAARPVERHRRGPVLESHGPDQADDAEHVVGVEVAEEHFGEREPDAVPHHLALGALAAIEQHGLPLALQGEARDVALDRGARRPGAEEGDGKHGGKVTEGGRTERRKDEKDGRTEGGRTEGLAVRRSDVRR